MDRVLSIIKSSVWLIIPMMLIHHLSLDADVMYNRALVLGNGEFWRVFTANFAHFNDSHLGLNVFGVLVATVLFREGESMKTWFLAWMVTMIGSTTHLLFTPDILWYVGMSGAVYGIFAFGAIRLIQRETTCFGWFLLGLMCMKLLMDFLHKNPASELLSMPVVDSAHVFGALTGVSFAVFANSDFYKLHIDKAEKSL